MYFENPVEHYALLVTLTEDAASRDVIFEVRRGSCIPRFSHRYMKAGMGVLGLGEFDCRDDIDGKQLDDII
jgi:hypothetical protein